MKTIFKILVILVLAAVVGGVFYGVVTATSSGADQSSRPEWPTNGEFSADGQATHSDQGEAGGMQFPADAIKNLAIISIVGVIYLNATRWLGSKKPMANLTS
jgi:hypothetical protein